MPRTKLNGYKEMQIQINDVTPVPFATTINITENRYSKKANSSLCSYKQQNESKQQQTKQTIPATYIKSDELS